MEEPSLFSDATSNQWGEISDSNSSSRQFPIKHPTGNGGASTSKFKGVVSQPNGHWGAQIYANHQRIWLGTFKSEKEAAMAYDSAAIKLRNGLTTRNFPWTDITVREPSFQDQFSTDVVLNMIKDGSYAAKFSDYLRAQDRQGYHLAALHDGLTTRNFPWTDITVREPSFQDQFSTEVVLNMIKDGSYAAKFSDYLRAQDRQGYHLAALHDTPGTKLTQLFQKELTPSDVSKLNRLVIPKKYALKYFPRIFDAKEQNGGSVDDIELVFFDRSMRSWNFRYCYWKSSQSFVFTRGWNRFAKEKGLRSRDRVIFSSYECNNQRLCVIDVEYDNGVRGGPVAEGNNDEEASQSHIKIGLACSSSHGNEIKRMDDGHGNEIERMDFEHHFGGNGNENEGENHCGENVPALSCNEKKKGLKLFGVQIV